MLRSIKNGGCILLSGVKALGKNPKIMVPMLICWAVYAPLVIYFDFHFPWRDFSFGETIGILFLLIFLLSLVFSWSAFVLLELIRQIETDSPSSMMKAFVVGVGNVIVALPVVVIWALIWFFLSVLEALLSKSRDRDRSGGMTPRNVAATLSGYESISFSRAFFAALKKGVRMTAFLIYPAIAWERFGAMKSIKRGLGIMKAQRGTFAAGFAATALAATVVFFPPGMLLYISDKTNTELPDIVWFWTIIYCAFAWSFCMFLEQMFVAELYLWHLLWEKEVELAEKEGRKPPKLHQVRQPSVMDGIPDLVQE